MPIIKYTGLYNDMLGSKQAKRIEGDRVDNGESWSKKFFADAKDLRMQLDEFGVGDIVNVKMRKDGKFWNIDAFEEAAPELVDKIKDTGGNAYPTKARKGSSDLSSSSSGTTTGGESSDKMTKAEWAEKDRKAKIGMSIHNSIAAASHVCKTGTSPEALVEYAKKLLPYLMLTELPDSGDDPLDPPTE